MKAKQRKIEFSDQRFVQFPPIPEGTKNLLVTGLWKNLCGVLVPEANGRYRLPNSIGAFTTNVLPIVNYLKGKNRLTLFCEKETIDYFCRLFTILEDMGCFREAGIDDVFKYIHASSIENNDVSEWFYRKEKNNMKFDMIIQNPPYKGDLHLDFLNLGLNLLANNGKMVIIEPSTWLISFRKNSKSIQARQRVEGHVEKVVFENLNDEFGGTGIQVPFSIVTIDMSKTFDVIDFYCCGEYKQVKSIYDCNLIGNYDLVSSILNKCKTFHNGDVQSNHVTDKKLNGNYWYAKYAHNSLGRGFCSDGTRTFSEATYRTVSNGSFHINYITSCYHVGKENIISENPLYKKDSNRKIEEGTIAGNIYGTKEELENWKYFVFNNKLPLFINICLNINQANGSKNFVPWLVDHKYTDDEINQLFNFTEEEIKLIDATLKKYERNSPWFRRYMRGKDSATDEEVNNFIKEISE